MVGASLVTAITRGWTEVSDVGGPVRTVEVAEVMNLPGIPVPARFGDRNRGCFRRGHATHIVDPNGTILRIVVRFRIRRLPETPDGQATMAAAGAWAGSEPASMRAMSSP